MPASATRSAPDPKPHHADRHLRHRGRAGPRHHGPEAAAAAREAGRSEDAGQGTVRPQDRAGEDRRPRSIGYYTHGCLAGGVALPINGPTWQVMRLSRNRNWGHPAADQDAGASRQKGAVDRLARIPGRRHVAAARRPDDHRPLEPSGRARRRRLADADAGPRADAPGARGDDGDQCRQRQMDRRAAGRLVGKIHRALQDARPGARRRARAGQPGDQEGAVPRRQRRPLLAAQDPPGGRSQLSFPYSRQLSEGQHRTARRSRSHRPTKAAARTSTAWFTQTAGGAEADARTRSRS